MSIGLVKFLIAIGIEGLLTDDATGPTGPPPPGAPPTVGNDGLLSPPHPPT